MTKKYKVVVLNQEDYGVYWTEVIGYYDDYEQASLRAYEMYGSVVEVEQEGIYMSNKYMIKYNDNGDAYFTMDGHDYYFNEYLYDGDTLYLDYYGHQAFNVEIEYGIDDYIILKEVIA